MKQLKYRTNQTLLRISTKQNAAHDPQKPAGAARPPPAQTATPTLSVSKVYEWLESMAGLSVFAPLLPVRCCCLEGVGSFFLAGCRVPPSSAFFPPAARPARFQWLRTSILQAFFLLYSKHTPAEHRQKAKKEIGYCAARPDNGNARTRQFLNGTTKFDFDN